MTSSNKVVKAIEKPAVEAYKLLRGGASIYMEFDGKKKLIKGEIFSTGEVPEYDVNSYFSGKLQVFHAGNGVTPQYVGAPLPAAPTNGRKPALSYMPFSRMSWTQEDIIGLKLTHDDKRKQEKAIMGGTANKAIAVGGIDEKKFSPWAHIKPDHLNFLDRLDPRIRVPAYVGANQVHTVFESAAKIYARKYGSIKVTRDLAEPIAGDSGLPSAMKLGFVLNGKDGSHHHFFHVQPYFTNAGGRNGDEKAIVKFLEIQKRLLDKGLPAHADQVILKGSAGRAHGSFASDYRYESVAANFLAAKLGNLTIIPKEVPQRTVSPASERTASPASERTVSPVSERTASPASERTASPASARNDEDASPGASQERKRKREINDALDDRSSDRNRSRATSRSR